MQYLLLRFVVMIWFYGTIISLFVVISRTIFDGKFGFKKCLRAGVYLLAWPITLFSESGRLKLIQLIKE
jgi:hypothetical protein